MQYACAYIQQCIFHKPDFLRSADLRRGVLGTVGPCTATGATGGNLEYYAVTFGVAGVMTSGAPAHSAGFTGHPGNELAPMTEFFNPNLVQEERT